MKRNRFLNIIFFVVLLVSTITTVNGFAWWWPPGGGDTTPPTLYFNSPASGATVSRMVTIEVTATDSGSGMDFVDFYIDSSYLGRDDDTSDSIFEFEFNSWEYTYGSHTLKAAAFDQDSNVEIKFRSISIDNDPVKLSYPSTGPLWHTDNARHPTDSSVYSVARKAAGYGMRKLLEEESITDGNTRYNIVMGLARFAEDWLTPKWLGDDDAKDDKWMAGRYSAFDSSMDYGDITISYAFDCRDISAFVTGMAMAIEAKILSTEYKISSGGTTRKHVVAFLKRGSSDWFLISVFLNYVDSNSQESAILNHIAGLTNYEPDIDKQYIFHFIYYLDVWYGTSTYMEEVGWVGWVDHDPDTYKIYQAPNFEYVGGYDFEYWDSNSWDIEVYESRRMPIKMLKMMVIFKLSTTY